MTTTVYQVEFAPCSWWEEKSERERAPCQGENSVGRPIEKSITRARCSRKRTFNILFAGAAHQPTTRSALYMWMRRCCWMEHREDIAHTHTLRERKEKRERGIKRETPLPATFAASWQWLGTKARPAWPRTHICAAKLDETLIVSTWWTRHLDLITIASDAACSFGQRYCVSFSSGSTPHSPSFIVAKITLENSRLLKSSILTCK